MSGIDGLPLPGTFIDAKSLGTTAEAIYSRREGQVIDYFIQNLSANTVYILRDANQDTSKGVKVVAGGNASKDNWTGDLIIVATAAASDVRYMIQTHPPPWQPHIQPRSGL